jgi:acetoacetyl-CoA synthetase
MKPSFPLWSPSSAFKSNSNLKHYMNWLNRTRNLYFTNYDDLWKWSTDHTDAFWKSLWEYFPISASGSFSKVMDGNMPQTKWFAGTQLSYSEHIFKKYTDQHPALILKKETGESWEVSWKTLRGKVAALQSFFIKHNIKQGDCIAAYLPCIPEATISFLAANSLGAVWSSCSPDFGIQSVIDRFIQIEPKIFIVVDGYHYGGKFFDKTKTVEDIVAQLPSVEQVIFISEKTWEKLPDRWSSWNDATLEGSNELKFHRVPFNHPIWVLYSSGTTGLPKAITHSTGGILLEHLKYLTFHNDIREKQRCFWYTTTGWMMWNYIQSSLLCGATVVLYDGNPAYPDMNTLWKFIEEAEINHFGISAGFIIASIKAQVKPSLFDLSSLCSIGSTGSPLPPEGFKWIYEEVSKDVWLTSMSGGTDVCSAFVGGNPLLPVYEGEIQCRALGCSLFAFDEDGNAATQQVGEMVITKPMPSMPVYFWNDPDFKRYHESYFEMYPGIWRHGDWIEITSHNGVIIYGRSDATLNRGGVRIGTSEIYRAVDKISEVSDSMIVCIEKQGGEFYMPLFVVMQDDKELTDEIKKKINSTIRTDYSPRHVPDEIIAVPALPYTISGKKTETPVKKILMGKDPSKVVNFGALKNPESISFFIDHYRKLKF